MRRIAGIAFGLVGCSGPVDAPPATVDVDGCEMTVAGASLSDRAFQEAFAGLDPLPTGSQLTLGASEAVVPTAPPPPVGMPDLYLSATWAADALDALIPVDAACGGPAWRVTSMATLTPDRGLPLDAEITWIFASFDAAPVSVHVDALDPVSEDDVDRVALASWMEDDLGGYTDVSVDDVRLSLDFVSAGPTWALQIAATDAGQDFAGLGGRGLVSADPAIPLR